MWRNVLHQAWKASKMIKAQWILANVHFSLFWLFGMCGNWAVCSDTSCQKYSYSLAGKSTKQWGTMQKVCSSYEDHHKDMWRAIRHVFDILMKITGVTLLLCKCVFSQTGQIFSIDFCTVCIWQIQSCVVEYFVVYANVWVFLADEEQNRMRRRLC